jgi:hypothetical protein
LPRRFGLSCKLLLALLFRRRRLGLLHIERIGLQVLLPEQSILDRSRCPAYVCRAAHQAEIVVYH